MQIRSETVLKIDAISQMFIQSALEIPIWKLELAFFSGKLGTLTSLEKSARIFSRALSPEIL